MRTKYKVQGCSYTYLHTSTFNELAQVVAYAEARGYREAVLAYPSALPRC
jgi:hypothetical protein